MNGFDSVEEALEELRNGKIILVTDDPDRENEGDFICAAEFATTENINFMATHGNASQWGNTYPSPQLILDDITEGNSYVCTEQDQIIATFYYKEGADPTYMRIYDGDWINDSRYGVVHRITSTGNVKGAASFCLNWALEQCGNIRIDTHRDNIVMQHLLDKNGFKYCGIVYVEDGTERIAYQKVV